MVAIIAGALIGFKHKKAIIDKTGDNAPYNGEPEYSINTDKAEELGFRFSNLKDWIYDLIDYYMDIE